MKIKKVFSEDYNVSDLNNSFLSVDIELEKTNKVVSGIKEDFESQKSTLASTIINTIYPIGVTYIQHTDGNGNFSSEKEPSSLFENTEWVELFAGESVFFRTSGEEAEEGRIDGIQKDQTKEETKDLSHSHSISGDELKEKLNHTHLVSSFNADNLQDGRLFAVNGNLSGRDYFTLQKSGQMWGYEAVSLKSENARYNSGYEEITTKTNSQQLTIGEGSETRPKNRLIKIWERIK